jgi:hypothetical protein
MHVFWVHHVNWHREDTGANVKLHHYRQPPWVNIKRSKERHLLFPEEAPTAGWYFILIVSLFIGGQIQNAATMPHNNWWGNVRQFMYRGLCTAYNPVQTTHAHAVGVKSRDGNSPPWLIPYHLPPLPNRGVVIDSCVRGPCNHTTAVLQRSYSQMHDYKKWDNDETMTKNVWLTTLMLPLKFTCVVKGGSEVTLLPSVVVEFEQATKCNTIVIATSPWS